MGLHLLFEFSLPLREQHSPQADKDAGQRDVCIKKLQRRHLYQSFDDSNTE